MFERIIHVLPILRPFLLPHRRLHVHVLPFYCQHTLHTYIWTVLTVACLPAYFSTHFLHTYTSYRYSFLDIIHVATSRSQTTRKIRKQSEAPSVCLSALYYPFYSSFYYPTYVYMYSHSTAHSLPILLPLSSALAFYSNSTANSAAYILLPLYCPFYCHYTPISCALISHPHFT